MIKFVIVLVILLLFVLLFMFRYDVTQGIFYAPRHCFQRLFGYNDFYDDLADVIMNIENRTIYYTYKKNNWRLELWKGDYGLFIGGEVGIYNKNPKHPRQHYNSAIGEDLIHMSMEIYHGDKLLLTRPYARYWWINGFKFDGLKNISSGELKMRTTLTFNDYESRDAFVNAYIKEYDRATIQFSTNNQNNSVTIDF